MSGDKVSMLSENRGAQTPVRDVVTMTTVRIRTASRRNGLVEKTHPESGKNISEEEPSS